MEFLDSDLFRYMLLPLFIFVARIMDLTLGTIRIIFVTRGIRKTGNAEFYPS